MMRTAIPIRIRRTATKTAILMRETAMAIRKMDMTTVILIKKMVTCPISRWVTTRIFRTRRTPARIFMRPTGVTE